MHFTARHIFAIIIVMHASYKVIHQVIHLHYIAHFYCAYLILILANICM
jgi:hypothetical protein